MPEDEPTQSQRWARSLVDQLPIFLTSGKLGEGRNVPHSKQVIEIFRVGRELVSRSMEFWFSIGSTYTYLSVVRVDAVAREQAVDVEWRPFNLRPITQQMNNRPFVGKPVKAAYMWRDIERRAAWRNVPINAPAPYPLADMELANRVAIVADQQGWLKAYVTEAYRRWMLDGQMAGSEPNLSASISACGRDPEAVLNAAEDAAIGEALAYSTDEAMKRGIFGSPSFIANGEIFWGDDRLEDALRWISGK